MAHIIFLVNDQNGQVPTKASCGHHGRVFFGDCFSAMPVASMFAKKSSKGVLGQNSFLKNVI
jgi:hypothetical protein